MLVLFGFDQDVDLVAGGDHDVAALIDELVEADDALGFVADVDDDGVFADFDDGARDDVAFTELVRTGRRCLEEGREAVALRLWSFCGFGHLVG